MSQIKSQNINKVKIQFFSENEQNHELQALSGGQQKSISLYSNSHSVLSSNIR